MHRAAGGGDGRGVSVPTLVRRLGEAGCAPGDGWVGTLDLLARSGLPVPEGFVLTTEAHREFLRASGLGAEILSSARGGRGTVRGHGIRSLGASLEREVRSALLDLGARTVVVASGQVLRRGLGTIPAVISAVREAWSSAGALERQVLAAAGGDIPTWPVLVQRQARPEYTGWTTTADLNAPRHGRSKDAPLHDVRPAAGRDLEGISGLTDRAGSVLDHTVRLGWGLEDGRWFLISVEKEPDQ